MSRLTKKFPFFLVLTTSFILLACPILFFGKQSAFFSLDPDVHYLSSSLSYIYQNLIRYTDHPGTPTIFFYIYSLTPFRILSKFLYHIPFETWTYLHYHFLYFTFRILQSIVLSLGLTLIAQAVYRLTRSYLSVGFALFAFYSYSVFPYFGVTISPEALSFVLIAIWINIFALYLETNFPWFLSLLALVSGFAIGNKFSNLFLAAATFFLALLHCWTKHRHRLLNSLFTSFLIVVGFVIATWPIKGAYRHLFSWTLLLATRTGVHGGGQQALFSPQAYLASATSLINLEIRAAIIIVFVVLAAFVLSVRRKLTLPILVVIVTALLGSLVFAKYPLSHYQLASYSLLIFCGSLMFSQQKNNPIAIVTLFFMLTLASSNYKNFLIYINTSIRQTMALDNFVKQNPPLIATVWEWGRGYDYALIWTRSWGFGFLANPIKQYRPDLLELTYPDKVITEYGKEQPLFELCWDQLYIQEVSLPVFQNAHPNRKFEIKRIPGSASQLLLKSNHCL